MYTIMCMANHVYILYLETPFIVRYVEKNNFLLKLLMS